MADLKKLTDSELNKLLQDVLREKDLRRAAPAVEAGKAEVVQVLRESGALSGPPSANEPPETMDGASQVPTWVDPKGDPAAMYLLGDVVSHKGRVWQSLKKGLNRWEPGSGRGNAWADCTPKAAESPRPSEAPDTTEGAGVSYRAGNGLHRGMR